MRRGSKSLVLSAHWASLEQSWWLSTTRGTDPCFICKSVPFKKNENLLHKQFPTEIFKIEFCLFVLLKDTEGRPPESWPLQFIIPRFEKFSIFFFPNVSLVCQCSTNTQKPETNPLWGHKSYFVFLFPHLWSEGWIYNLQRFLDTFSVASPGQKLMKKMW